MAVSQTKIRGRSDGGYSEGSQVRIPKASRETTGCKKPGNAQRTYPVKLSAQVTTPEVVSYIRNRYCHSRVHSSLL
jgi:hypothetical protein